MSARAARGATVALLLATLAAGCADMPSAPASRPAYTHVANITPGMTSQEVLNRFGPPNWTFGVRQENLTIWNYRFSRSECLIYQVSVRPDGTVRDAGPSPDPACDGPNDRR